MCQKEGYKASRKKFSNFEYTVLNSWARPCVRAASPASFARPASGAASWIPIVLHGCCSAATTAGWRATCPHLRHGRQPAGLSALRWLGAHAGMPHISHES